MIRKVYLVDTENVGVIWKYILFDATNNDKIILFYTDNTPNLGYADLNQIQNLCDRFTMEKCYTGSNALDFQLISYMSYYMKSCLKSQFIIVSNDTGYDSVIYFWKDRGRDIIRLKSDDIIKMYKKSNKEEREKSNTVVQQEIKLNKPVILDKKKDDDIISLTMKDTLSKENVSWIKTMLNKFSLNKLQDIHRECVKKYGQINGTDIYKAIKPVLKEYYK